MEDFEIRTLDIGLTKEKELAINVGGHGGDTEFLKKSEVENLISYLQETVKQMS